MYGLRTWGADGAPQLDVTVRLPRLVYSWALANPTLASDLEGPDVPYTSPFIAGLVNDGTWLVYCHNAMRVQWLNNGHVICRFFSSSGPVTYVSFIKL